MKRKSRQNKSELIFEELEPRLLLSADPLAIATDAGTEAVHEFVLPDKESELLLQQTTDQFEQTQQHSKRSELVIIDSRAPNFQQLHNDVIEAQQQGRKVHVVVLDAHRDGIEQINEALASFNQLDAVHIVSHGDDGQLELGATQLNKDNLREYADTISGWKQAFSENGDLLIYGCNLAESAEGKSMVDVLGYLTATDVAASDDLTGNRLMGGDWELEYEAGNIETDIAFSEQVQNDWQGTLDAAAQAAAEEQQAAQEQRQQEQEQQAQAELEQQQAAINEEEQAAAKQEEGDQEAAITQEQRQEIVIIDESVTDFQSFIDDLQANNDPSTTFEIVLLDSNSNGVERISAILEAYNDVDALHIFSHGDDGAVKLGNAWLMADNLDDYSDTLYSWSESLDVNADLMIYGCNLAESTQGEQFIDRLADLTGADVAASDDRTGNTLVDGDWQLEYTTGTVEANVVISDDLQGDYQHALATFTVTSLADSGAGSLRQAIIDANTSGGADIIRFDVSGTINLSTALPNINSLITIDATTVPGYAGEPLVQLNGASVSGNGLTFMNGSDGSSVSGLMIVDFGNHGIQIDAGADGISITGNWIGTTGNSSSGVGNSQNGINVQGANTIIGGTGNYDGNVITNNGNEGINITGSGATGTFILGNIIGLDPNGTTGGGNSDVGIALLSGAHNTTIGGSNANARNIISNNYEGIEINSNNNSIQGNYIGTDITGTLDRGNRSDDGIEIQNNATGNLIGGTEEGAGNLIAFNLLDGVNIVSGSDNVVLGNEIYSNGDQDIDIAASANGSQSAPVLSFASVTGGEITICGSLNTAPNDFYRVEFFAESGGAQTYLGFANVATDGAGNATINTTLNASVAVGATIRATATDSDAGYATFGNSSELSGGIATVAGNDAPTFIEGAFGNWSFDEGSGDSIAESAIGISSGMLGSTAGADANDPTWTTGKFGQALHFDGVDDYVEIADAPGIDISGPEFSASLWMKPDSGPNKEDMLFMKGDRQGNVNYYLSWKDSGVMTWAFKEGANWHYQDIPVTLPTTGQWNHVAITFDRPTVSLYINGTKYVFDNVATGGSMDNDLTANDEVLWIGAGRDGGAMVGVNQWSGPFSGSIDELALFDRALTDAEVEAIRTSAPPVVTASAFSIDENSANNTVVGTVVANDPDVGDTLSYAITAGNTGGAFAIDASGQITVANSAALDFETNPVFNLTIEATDDGSPNLSDSTTVTITLNNVSEAPTLVNNTGLTAAEGSTTVITNAQLGYADAEQPASSIVYSVTSSPANGQLELTTNLDVAITSFTQAQIDAGEVVYAHDGSETTADSFGFTVDDGQDNYASGPTILGISTLTNVSSGISEARAPDYSPDGSKIVFARNNDIYIMDADGSNQTPLVVAAGGDFQAVWSPDGSKIAFTSNRDVNNEIYVIDVDGSNETNITTHAANDSAPAWSPDGTKIAFTSDRDGDKEIWVMDADGTNLVQLTSNTAIDGGASWSPDGSKIVFQSTRDGGDYEIYVMDADGNNQTRLTSAVGIDALGDWSPDGSKLLFYSERDGNREIYVMDADGNNQVRLTNDAGIDMEAEWSPDGSSILFSSDRDGDYDIYSASVMYENTFAITVTAQNDAPTDLLITATSTGGLSLNQDGGNDAYLLAGDGNAVFGGLTATTMEIQFSSTTLPVDGGDTDFVTYGAATQSSNNIWFGTWRNDAGAGHQLGLGVDGAYRYATGFDANTLFDGELHTVSVTWDNTSGDYEFFVDGVSVGSGTGFKSGHTVPGGGALVVGMEQDSIGGGFQSNQVLQATVYDVRIFDDARTAPEILAGHGQTLAPTEPGMLANWVFDNLSTNGAVIDSVGSNNLSVMHASGAGFIGSVPSLTMTLREDAPNSTVVGTAAAIDPDSGDTFTYSLLDNAGGRFDINSSNGEIFVLDGSLIDFETASSHNVTVQVTDSGGLTYDEVFTVSVNNANDAPVMNALDGNPTFVENGSPVVLDSDVTIYDAELSGLDNFAGASLTLERNGGANSDDVFSATGTLGALTEGGNLVVGGATIGTVTINSAGTLLLTFNANATNALVDLAIQQIAYSNSSDAPPADVQIDWSFGDGNVGAQGSGGAMQALGSITVNITAVNDAPTAQDKTIFTAEDTTYTFTLSDFGYNDVDGDPIALVRILPIYANVVELDGVGLGATTHEISITDINDGKLTFTPPLNIHGTADFIYFVVNDGTVDSAFKTMAATITPVNDAPVANNDPGVYSTSMQDLNPLGYWRLGEVGGTAADLGSTANIGTYNGGTLSQSGGLFGDTDTAVYFNGTSDYVEIAHSNDYLLDNGTIQLWFNVDNPANGDLQHLFSKDAHGFVDGGHVSMYLNTSGQLEVRLQSSTADYIVRSTAAVSAGDWHHAAFSFGASGMQLYLDGVLVDSDGYTGGLGTTSGGSGNIEGIAIGAGTQNSTSPGVTPVNQMFAGSIDEVAIFGGQLNGQTIQRLYDAGSNQMRVSENGSLNLSAGSGVLANDTDVDGDTLAVTEVNGSAIDVGSQITLASGALVTLNSDGSMDYAPNGQFESLKLGETATDTFNYTVSDGNGETDTATVTITIVGENDAPTVDNAIADQTATEGTPFSFQFASNVFGDVDGDALTYTSDASGWLSFDAATRTFSGTPLNADVGTTTVTVTANDGNGGTVSDTFDIVIGNTNDVPTVDNAIANQSATEDTPFSFQFASNVFGDVDGDTLTYTSDASGWLSFDAATRTFSGTPLNADVGTTTVTVTADDGNGGTISDAFDIVIGNANDAPTVANVIPDQVAIEDIAFSFQFASNTFNDVDGDTLTYTSDASGWLSFDAATRTFSGTPLNVDVGTTTVTVTADDGNGGTVSYTFDIVVGNSNDAPTVANVIPDQVATEDTAFSFQFASNTFNDADGDTLIYSSDASGWLSFDAATRTFSGTPLNADVGTTTVTVTADDGNGGTVSDTFDIVISNSNDAPAVANVIPDQVATEDSVFTFTFAANTFDDVDGDTLTYTSDASGWLSFDAATRTFSGTPLNADVGTTTVTVTADDCNGGTVSDTFDIVISNTNDAPTVANVIPDQVAIEDSAFTFTFAANTFNDTDGDTLTYTSDASGWLSFDAATRTFSGTPLNADVGTTTVTVTADDGNGGTVSDTFDIVISNSNDAPTVANVIPDQVATEDSAFTFTFAANTFNDTDGDTLTYTSDASGWLSFDAPTRTFSGTPLNADVGTTTVTVTADDGNGGTVSDTFDIVISNTNDAAVIGGVDTGTVTEDLDPDADALLETSGTLTIIDLDVGESSFNAGVFGGSYGVIMLDAAGNWAYAANTSQAAIQGLTTSDTLNDTITISSADGTPHDIVIAIMGTNDAPIAGNDVASVTEGGAVMIDVAANDSDIDSPLDLNSVTITGLPAHGSVVVNGDGTVTYSHDGSEAPVDSFSYSISDISGAFNNTATVTISVNPVNDAPAATDDAITVAEGNAVLIDLAANDSDVDNPLDLNSITIIGAPANGALSVNGDGTVTYTHDGSNTTSDSFSYSIADISGAISNTATVTINVSAVNDAPTTSGIADVTVDEDAPATHIDLNAAFADSDNLDSELRYSIVGNTDIGLFSAAGIDGNGQLTLAYAANMNGATQISIRATDPSGQSVDTLFTVNVTPVNDNPVLASNTGMVTTNGAPTTINGEELHVTDIDNPDTELVYTITALPANGNLMLNSVQVGVSDTFTQADLDNNRLVYVASGTAASDAFGFTVSDTDGGTMGNNTFNIALQLRPMAEKNNTTTTEGPVTAQEEPEVPQEQTVLESGSGGLVEGAGGYGGEFVPFGSAAVPPPPKLTPVLSLEPTATTELSAPRQVTTLEDIDIVSEVEDYELSTFAAVQVQSMEALWTSVDKMKQEMTESAAQMDLGELKVVAAKSSGVVLTAGIVAWAMRGGALLSSLMSTIPLWKGYDPLPILAYKDDEDEGETKAKDINEDMIPTSLDELKKLKELKDKARQYDVDALFGGSATREQ